jgi:hypothetical protein
MKFVLLFTPIALLVVVGGFDLMAAWLNWKLPFAGEYRIVAGEHAGRAGRIVSMPWLANGYGMRVCINVSGEDGKRELVYVWKSQTERLPRVWFNT